MSPQNAELSADGFRFYEWAPADGSEPTSVLSVTSIRKLCGEPFRLVNWQLANLADAALGTMKKTVIGPRGGVKDIRQVWEYPCEFAQRYDATEGNQGKVDDLRKWLRSHGDSARDIAAIRGTIVHECIEKNVQTDAVSKVFIEAMRDTLRDADRKKMPTVTDEDHHFIQNAVRQYWAMRAEVPFVIIAREIQIFNLTAGYAGSADAMVWFLPGGVDPDSIRPARLITWDYIKEIGGDVSILDWKTSTDIHTDNVTQVSAYICGEFVGSDGIVDERLTEILTEARSGGIVHIRPDKWGVYRFGLEQEVVRAFLGSVAFARFLAKYPEPNALFNNTITGRAE